MEPVGMVAAVSMNTIWNRKKARMPELAPSPPSIQPLNPANPCPPINKGVANLSPAHALRLVGENDHAEMLPIAG
jgi:hypothetical protein